MTKRKVNIAGNTVACGERMKIGKGWRLVAPDGGSFKAVLKSRVKIGGEIVAIFRVWPHPDSKLRSLRTRDSSSPCWAKQMIRILLK